jgi:hypothetical protein
MKNFGNPKLKKECYDLFAPHAPDLAPEYTTPYWDRVHALVQRAFVPDCDIDEAAIIIVQLAGDIIYGFKSGEITLGDFHFVQNVFTHVDFTYSTEMDLDLYFDGELYGLVEGLDFGATIEENQGFFNEFMAYLKLKHPLVHARITTYLAGLAQGSGSKGHSQECAQKTQKRARVKKPTSPRV